jgi:hypothetical protein
MLKFSNGHPNRYFGVLCCVKNKSRYLEAELASHSPVLRQLLAIPLALHRQVFILRDLAGSLMKFAFGTCGLHYNFVLIDLGSRGGPESSSEANTGFGHEELGQLEAGRVK